MGGGAELLDLLRREAGPWPAPVKHLDETGSTNDVLKQAGRAGAPSWSVVLADRQTQGRGRHGRAWVSPPGNLYLSVLLRPQLERPLAGLVPLVAGLAVAEALDRFEAGASVKWPNDVLVGEAKIAGLLAEATSGPGGVEDVVLGIGVNVASAPETASAEAGREATCLHAVSSLRPGPVEVAASVLVRLRSRQAELERSGPAVLEAWRDRAVPWWGETVEVVCAGETLSGRLVAVDDSGALVLETGGGRSRILAGDARRVLPRARKAGPP